MFRKKNKGADANGDKGKGKETDDTRKGSAAVEDVEPIVDLGQERRNATGQTPSKNLPDKAKVVGIDNTMYMLGHPNKGFFIWAAIGVDFIKDEKHFAGELEKLVNTPEFEKFRFNVVTRKGVPMWERMEPYNFMDHLKYVKLNKANDSKEFEKYFTDLMNTTCFREGPLWTLRVVTNYASDGTKNSTILFGVNHTITDGIGLIRLCLMATLGDDKDITKLFPFVKPKEAPAGKDGRPKKPSLGKKAKLVHGVAHKVAKGIADAGFKNISRDRDGALKSRKPFVNNSIAMGRLVKVTEIRDIARAMDVTVHSAITAIGTGAMRRYLKRKDDLYGRKTVMATGPFPLVRKANLGGGAAAEFSNQMGVVLSRLPVGEANRVKRARTIKKNIDDMKFSPEAWMTHLGMRQVAMMPRSIKLKMVNMIGDKVTTGFSNIPGPNKIINFAGYRFRSILFIAPCWFPTGMGTSWSFVSYNGWITPCVACDASVVPDANELMRLFLDELKEYKVIADVYAKAKEKETGVKEEKKEDKEEGAGKSSSK